MTTRTSYTPEFKRQAIELAAREDVGRSRAARDLGISLSALYRWREQAKKRGERAFPGQGRVALTTQEQELKRLQKENEILRQEREILVKRPVLGRTAPVWGLPASSPKKVIEVRIHRPEPHGIPFGHHVSGTGSHAWWLPSLAKKAFLNAKN